MGAPVFSTDKESVSRVLYPQFTGADLTGADLRGATLDHIDLSSTKLARANLAGADLRNCIGLSGAA